MQVRKNNSQNFVGEVVGNKLAFKGEERPYQ